MSERHQDRNAFQSTVDSFRGSHALHEGDMNEQGEPDVVPIFPAWVAPDTPRDVAIPLEGVVVVTTESGSKYEMDFDTGYFRRIRGEVPSEDPEVAPASRLRRDGDELKILRVIALRVGRAAVLDVEPLGDPRMIVFTRRTTTRVVAIERVGE